MPDAEPPQSTAAHKSEDPLSITPSAAAPLPAKPSDSRQTSWFRRFLNLRQKREDTLRDALEELISEEPPATESVIAGHERSLISNVLALRDMTVVDVMIPRADIFAIDIRMPRPDVLKALSERPLSRLPVYKDDLDNLLGVIHMKDLFVKMACGVDFEIQDLIREPIIVSPAMRVMDLILLMRQAKTHIAFVVDEYGGIDGLVTVNDLIEALVGEISDEHNLETAPQLIERNDGTAIADARYPIEDFEARFGDVFEEDEEREEVDTLGGLVTYLAGRVPMRGEIIRHDNGIEFAVLEADPRRIMRLKIRNLPPPVTAAQRLDS